MKTCGKTDGSSNAVIHAVADPRHDVVDFLAKATCSFHQNNKSLDGPLGNETLPPLPQQQQHATERPISNHSSHCIFSDTNHVYGKHVSHSRRCGPPRPVSLGIPLPMAGGGSWERGRPHLPPCDHLNSQTLTYFVFLWEKLKDFQAYCSTILSTL